MIDTRQMAHTGEAFSMVFTESDRYSYRWLLAQKYIRNCRELVSVERFGSNKKKSVLISLLSEVTPRSVVGLAFGDPERGLYFIWRCQNLKLGVRS